ncbi:hypothetical protein EYF80_005506 [Liparis tanakae]|uniref:Uncharacterized protein n=1 Tax=Liparis tanakae TaxID=230148 RepID=A0A4Z2J1S3_9TELE|nr:hypothetical protein EYF80_005506 [Liparis tanakae]
MHAYLYSLHQQHGLRVVLVRLQDEVSQFVDDDVQGTLLLQRLAEVQLRGGRQPWVKGTVVRGAEETVQDTDTDASNTGPVCSPASPQTQGDIVGVNAQRQRRIAEDDALLLTDGMNPL